MPFAKTWVVLEGTMLWQISQTEKDKYCITYMWTLKMQQTCEYNNNNNKKQQTHRCREQISGGERDGARTKQRQQIKRHKLLCTM